MEGCNCVSSWHCRPLEMHYAFALMLPIGRSFRREVCGRLVVTFQSARNSSSTSSWRRDVRPTRISSASLGRFDVGKESKIQSAVVAPSFRAFRQTRNAFFGEFTAQGPVGLRAVLNRYNLHVNITRDIVATIAPETSKQADSKSPGTSEVRVRFAPSPTGHLHVGGARTALFNWLYARNRNGTFIVRVEDTDVARSTRESEEAVLRDLKWLGVHWDEGPDIGGPYGPYRQSERSEIYKEYANKLVADGHAYPCFCTDQVLDAKRKVAEARKEAPHYDGTCRHLSKDEVAQRIAAGEPHTYRFKIPDGESAVSINDSIRGQVTWSTDTLGDFILLRSSGMPVYNFCVAVDDALMRITHVIRAEEHLPNTLRQILIYKALGFTVPEFAHVSLILGEDRSKLSKRHGATSLDQFAQEGFLAPAMINYLALLGWNDGSEQEVFAVDDLVQKFTLERITKSAAVFDQTKLQWINGQHIRSVDAPTVAAMLARVWGESGVVQTSDGAPLDPASEFVVLATDLFKASLDKLTDANTLLEAAVSYPLLETFAGETPGAKGVEALLSDGFRDVAARVVKGFEEGELSAEVQADPALYKEFAKAVGVELGRKGKKLFMPLRLALTGQLQGPDVGEILRLIDVAQKAGLSVKSLVPLAQRIEGLRAWLSSSSS